MKLAVSGKGGVGKTTLIALFARILKERQKKVILIDADPDMNLATVLGIPSNVQITPIVELKELIAERTGVEVGKSAPFFKMNPKVDDIPDKYSTIHRGIRLMVMGSVKKGGGGCACPENAFLKNLLAYLVLSRDEWILLDLEAGIEHLGRGTAIGVDHMIVLVEPNHTSIETAFRIQKLSQDIGIKSLHIVGNKIQTHDEKRLLQEKLKDFHILGFIDYSDSMRKISLNMLSPMDIKKDELVQIADIVEKLTQIPQTSSVE